MIILLGEERANLSAFRMFVRFALVWFCLFLLLGVWEGQQFVTVALLGLFSQLVGFEMAIIMKTCLYNFDPLKPHFYIVKLGFTGVYIIFLIFAQKIDCGYSLELPRRGGSNEYPQSMF